MADFRMAGVYHARHPPSKCGEDLASQEGLAHRQKDYRFFGLRRWQVLLWKI
jgi:hypothetical protein